MRQATTFKWTPYDANEYRQTKDGVMVENKDVKSLPETFYGTAQHVDSQGRIVSERVLLLPPDAVVYQVALANNTDHILRLNNSVFRLFDPAGNQIEPTDKTELLTYAVTKQIVDAAQKIPVIKMIDRSVELVPGTTTMGWMCFRPPSTKVPGVWRLALYEIPVQYNDAGAPVKTTRFELRTVVKKFNDTYRQEGAFADEQLVESKEVAE